MNITKNGKKKMRLIDVDRKPNKIYKVYASPYASYYEGYIVNEFCIKEDAEKLALDLNNNLLRQYNYEVIEEDEPYENYPTVEAIPVWYIIRWYEKRYKLGSTVADDWERGLLKEKIVEMQGDFKNEKYLDNKQESERFAQMVKEVIELYNDWEKENDS